jgi:hypothetical protein
MVEWWNGGILGDAKTPEGVPSHSPLPSPPIPPSPHSTIPLFHHSTIPVFHHSIIPLFRRIALLLLLLTLAAPVGAQDSWRGQVEALVGTGGRTPGSPANLVLAAKVAERFAASGLEHGAIRFPTTVFVPGAGTLSLADGTTWPIRPMHATLARPGNFAETRFAATLVHLGQGNEADLGAVKGVDLRGSIAVLESGCGDRWQRLLRFGVTGFLFLGDETGRPADALAKVYASEVAVPRYYLDPEPAKALRQRFADTHSLPATVQAEPSRLRSVELNSPWVLIPGSDETLGREVVMVTAPLDANCVVPELAAGAQAALNLQMLLELLERFRKAPPPRSVLLVAVNAHTASFQGERELAWSLLVPRDRLERTQDVIASDVRVQEMLLSYYSKFSLDPPTAADAKLVVALRNLTDSSTGKHFTVKEPIVDLARREVNLLKTEKIQVARLKLPKEEAKRRAEDLDDRKETYVNVLTLFNKVGVRTELLKRTPAEAEILRGFVDEIVTTRSLWVKRNRAELDRVAANAEIRQKLGDRRVVFALNLELVWTNGRFGLSANNDWALARWPHKFGISVARIAEGVGDEELTTTFVDAMTMQGGLPELHYFPEPSEAVAVLQAAGPTPAFAVRNTYSGFGRAFTPQDTLDHIDWQSAGRLRRTVPKLLAAMLADPHLTLPSELLVPTGRTARWAHAWAVQVKSFKFDEFSASVMPQLPVPGSLVIVHPGRNGGKPIVSGDVVGPHISLTDERAAVVFYGCTANLLQTGAFHYDPDFRTVDHVIDAGDAELKMTSNINRNTPARVLALFECQEFPIYARENPASISVAPITEHQYLALSGRLNAPPKKYGMSGASTSVSKKSMPRATGPAAFYLQKDERLKLLTAGRILALNADPDQPEGEGFLADQGVGRDYFARAVRDMSVLNHYRMERLSGISDELAKVFLERGDAAIEKLDEARQDRDYLGYFGSLYEALGAHSKAYGRMAEVTNDMLKAVVFYLALMLPFCFFVEKLLFKFRCIEQEMAAFGGLFILTFLVFRNIHPAFRVAQAPEAIFIAFVMGGLGAFVIKILHGRFEGEMQLLFKTYPGMERTTAAYSMVGQEAMLIGVNNMKRRRIRTALTTATIVLVTFTMLAFTSISRRLSPTIVTKAKQAPYTGLMYHWPGNGRMDEATMRALREVFAEQGDVIVRRWMLPPKSRDQSIPYKLIAGEETANVEGVLGLQPAEQGFIDRIPLASGRFFQSNGAEEAILPAALAKALGITDQDVGTRDVLFNGTALRVVGILRDEEFRMLKDLNQRPILPIKSLLAAPGGGGPEDLAAIAQEEEEGESGVFYTDLAALLLTPEETARRLGAQPYSVSVRLHDQATLWSAVDQLLTITKASKFHIASAVPFKVGEGARRETKAGVYYVGEGYRTSIGGLAFLIIPLLISSTIILNTMLGSVFERKGEIAIYNAVGLNPTHIGLFFLAESFVYSVIGSVGGYLIGQMTSIFLTRTGIITDINLNFSSLSVVYVILFTVAIVMLSTLYPSMVATKSAVPSGKRKWSLPDNDGNEMHVVFPFIYQPDLVLGIMGYLGDYFSRFTEASFGDLIADLHAIQAGEDDAGRPTYGIHYDIALAPFDLGVTQRVEFVSLHDERVQAHRVIMDIRRVSGQDSNWTATNKPFLEGLRTYLLHWRNLTAAEHEEFVRKGRELTADATSQQGQTD